MSERIFETMRERYQSQRDRREQIRRSVAIPVTALAFSVYTLAWVADRVDVANWQQPLNFAAISLMVASALCLLAGALLIIRMERNVIYLDPPDLEELVSVERQLREDGRDDAEIRAHTRDLLTASYDIIYRRYFASNEQATRNRTRGLHLIVAGLCLNMVALMILPFQAGAGS